MTEDNPIIETSPDAFLKPYQKIPVDEPGIILMGASAVGKSTLRNMVCGLADDNETYVKHLRLSTRAPRPHKDQEYRHVMPDVMDALHNSPNVLIDTMLYGNEYMTLWPEKLPVGSVYVYIYRPQAAIRLRRTFPNLKFVHIVPTNTADLSGRIIARNPDIAPKELQTRIAEIESEIAQCDAIADATIINDGSIEVVAHKLRGTMNSLITN